MNIKNQIKLSLAILAAAAGAIVVLLILPTYQDIQQSSEEMALQKQELASLEDKIGNIEEFKAHYKDISENLGRISELFVNSKAPTDFISFIETGAQESQLSVEIFPSAPKQESDDKWRSILFRTESASPFSSFIRFLEKLESSPYLLEVQTLRITKLLESDLKTSKFENASLGDVKANLSVKTFSD
jgi:hypothetical protein